VSLFLLRKEGLFGLEKIIKQHVFFLGENTIVKQLLKNVQDKKQRRCFDFNKIIPMPPEIYSGPINGDSIAQYGENNWYDWCKKNWGTINNACDPAICGNMLEFSTVCGVPRPIYVALSSQYPLLQIKVVYASKDHSAIGSEIYQNGSFEKAYLQLSDDEIWHGLWGSDGGITNATSA
jgi:hypothetical protein